MYRLKTKFFYWITVTLLFISHTSFSQYKILDRISAFETIPVDHAIIYGSFVQRLAFSSGGFQQDIRIVNIDTEELYTFSVKSAMKSSKENPFIYFIKAGRYAILDYVWIKSKWYGGKIFTERIYNWEAMEKAGKEDGVDINEYVYQRFTFEVAANTVNYTGTWHFENEDVFFSTDKENLDKKLLKSTKQKFGFDKAKIAVPK